MRILHTSDWHIGRQFHHVSLLEDQAYILDQFVALAEREKVDVVLISGDLYDRAIPPANAVSLVDKTLNRLCNHLDIPVIIIAGNHDGPERLSFGSRQLSKANLHISGSLLKEIEPIVIQDKYGDVSFYPVPYADPATVRSLYLEDDTETLQTYDQCMDKIIQPIVKQIKKDKKKRKKKHKKQRSVAVVHCFLAGGESTESERPLSVGGSDQISYKHFKHFDYSALGHLHQQQKRGCKNIRYSGSILKYSFSEEKHKKSVTLVDMNAEGDCEIQHLSLIPLRDMRSITGALDDILANAKKDKNRDDYLLIALTDTDAILDPMGKLREVYPNVLHLERPNLQSSRLQKFHRDVLKKDELSMFKDFFKQVHDQDLSDQQEKLLKNMLDDMHGNREIKAGEQ